MVEFALVAPVVLLAVFLLIDFGRLLYAYSSISSASREGARILSLKSDQLTDCYAFQQMEKAGQGFRLTYDPNSVTPNNDPNFPGAGHNPIAPSLIPAGQADVYIYPAVATASPPDATANCASTTPRPVSQTTKSVAVEIQYHFTPLTPLVSSIMPNLTLKSISVTETEY